MQEGDVIMTYANIDKLHALTGYTPQTKLEEGIRLFVSWFKWYRGKDHEN
jgi:UDP-glucuronate 4-epimerase